MDKARRDILKSGGGLLALLAAAGLARPGSALAQQWNKAAFETKNLNDTLKAMGGANAAESKDIQFVNPTPDIAENGAVVPVTVTSNIPRTQSIAIMVEKNPNMLSANFEIPEGTEAFVSTRLKMGETSDVIALVKADGKYFYARKEIKVTLGGCGG
jgi:sulfur-oxidizing protein SoxY